MKVTKRNGDREEVKFDKIFRRINKMTTGLDLEQIDVHKIAIKVIDSLYDGITTRELDRLTSEISATLATHHPDYNMIGGRICASALHKETPTTFSKAIQTLWEAGIIRDDIHDLVKSNSKILNAAINDERDYEFDYFALKTFERSYLLKTNKQIIERPQYLFMRVALEIWRDNIDKVIECYEAMSTKKYIHATPTLFNAGTKLPQLSSCFLLSNKGDSIDGLADTLKDIMHISKLAGGIGLSVHNVRAKGSLIRGTGGYSDGLVPYMKTLNEIAKWINQGGKRKGSFAIYLEPWHADIEDFLRLKTPHGKEETKARDLFYAIWMNDLFMQRVEQDADWTLMCPNQCPGLSDVHSEEFAKLYTSYEKEGKGMRTVKARDIWKLIVTSQIETGGPYITFKDPSNSKSNQQNLGTISCQNLCTEIVEFSSKDEEAVCNLASIKADSFVNPDSTIDYELLEKTVYNVIFNLNRVIDVNYYQTKETKNSNLKHRPVGLGIQGLADVFMKLNIAFDSDKAKEINKMLFETIYYGAMTASWELAKRDGKYESFDGSPLSKGKFQFDLWNSKPDTDRYDWNTLRKNIKKDGVRNSLLLCQMPTASSASLFMSKEACEAQSSNLEVRGTLSGEHIIVTKKLVYDLVKLKLWNNNMRNKIMAENGSIQNIPEIPTEIKEVYKTVYEISQKDIIDMSADRGKYICQSQSMNLFLEKPNYANITSMIFYAWKAGLKTGIYYLRTKPAVQAIKFKVNKEELNESKPIDNSVSNIKTEITHDAEAAFCSIDNPDACISCGS